jgi:hypothetical protein
MEEQVLQDGPSRVYREGVDEAPMTHEGERRYYQGEREAGATLTPGQAQGLPRSEVRQIIINALHHGYLVDVGCQRIAIESVDKLISILKAYLKDPEETERRYSNRELL